MHLAVYAHQNNEEVVTEGLLWRPSHGKTARGRPYKSHVSQLANDTDCLEENLPTLMVGENKWRECLVRS